MHRWVRRRVTRSATVRTAAGPFPGLGGGVAGASLARMPLRRALPMSRCGCGLGARARAGVGSGRSCLRRAPRASRRARCCRRRRCSRRCSRRSSRLWLHAHGLGRPGHVRRGAGGKSRVRAHRPESKDAPCKRPNEQKCSKSLRKVEREHWGQLEGRHGTMQLVLLGASPSPGSLAQGCLSCSPVDPSRYAGL